MRIEADAERMSERTDAQDQPVRKRSPFAHVPAVSAALLARACDQPEPPPRRSAPRFVCRAIVPYAAAR